MHKGLEVVSQDMEATQEGQPQTLECRSPRPAPCEQSPGEQLKNNSLSQPASPGGPSCPICLQDIPAQSQIARTLPCQHIYCKPCLLAWVDHKGHAVCAVCRATLHGYQFDFHSDSEFKHASFASPRASTAQQAASPNTPWSPGRAHEWALALTGTLYEQMGELVDMEGQVQWTGAEISRMSRADRRMRHVLQQLHRDAGPDVDYQQLIEQISEAIVDIRLLLDRQEQVQVLSTGRPSVQLQRAGDNNNNPSNSSNRNRRHGKQQWGTWAAAGVALGCATAAAIVTGVQHLRHRGQAAASSRQQAQEGNNVTGLAQAKQWMGLSLG